ncbi:MAG: hypothetical protein MSG64_06745 [Pyrinomonadaceae bacterium MAG19_C2-C3]|nr:hypothetical protein [Pyrinomonadaceae bacterium MAG19_C2-C3]
MTTEELIQDMNAPLMFELEYADEAEFDFVHAPATVNESLSPADASTKPHSKKDRIIELFKAGTTDVADIVRHTHARPSYVAQVLQRENLISGYFDLYTTTNREQNVYSRFFRNALQFKTTEAARASVEKLDKLYNYFERLGDRAGQHQAMVLALTGKNRARWSGKHEAAQVFGEWLASH